MAVLRMLLSFAQQLSINMPPAVTMISKVQDWTVRKTAAGTFGIEESLLASKAACTLRIAASTGLTGLFYGRPLAMQLRFYKQE